MSQRTLRVGANSPYHRLIGVGGIGTGLFFALEGQHTLGRNESRPARLLNIRDYCKLHIITHYISVLLGAKPSGTPFHMVPVGKVGRDEAGRRMITEMAAAGMDTRHVEPIADRPTLFSVCFQYPDGSGGNITTSESAASALTCTDVDRCAGLLAPGEPPCIVLAAPEAPLDVRGHLLRLARANHSFRAASFTSAEIEAARSKGLFSDVELLAMNEDEAEKLVGSTLNPAAPQPFLEKCADVLMAFQEHIQIILSAGNQGAFAFSEGTWDYRPALNVPVVSTAGAGDALLAGVLLAIAAGIPFIQPDYDRPPSATRPVESAFDFGVLLAAYTVTSPHTIHPDASMDSLLAFAQRLDITFSGTLMDRVDHP